MNRLLWPGLNLALLITGLICLVTLSFSVAAETPGSFDDARRISAESGKPLLIEFYRDG